MMRQLDFDRQSNNSATDHTDHWHKHLQSIKSPGLKSIDLFAGCGGLSLGLEKAGFNSVLAVEKSPMAAETYYHNFIRRLPPDPAEAKREWSDYCSLPLQQQVETGLVVDEVAAVLAYDGLMNALREQDIDLVAGGPPCQGFSMAGRRNPGDIRNQLPWQFLEFVEQLQPKAVVIENVVGIGQDFLKHGAEAPFGQLRLALEATPPGYVAQPLRLNAMNFGVPQHRPRMLLVALRKDYADRHALTAGLSLWRSDSEAPEPVLAPQRVAGSPLTVKEALWDLSDDGYVAACDGEEYRTPVGRYAAEMRCDPAWLPPALPEELPPSYPANHTLRKHASDIALRFQVYQYLATQGVPGKIFNIPMLDAPECDRQAAVVAALANCEFPAKAPTGRTLANTVEELAYLVMTKGTRKHSQRPLNECRPSPTVMSLPDDFVHYHFPRTLSVREMARIQSFPDRFEFRSKETTGSHRRRVEVPQYTQVGNAVPPKMAAAVGHCIQTLIRG